MEEMNDLVVVVEKNIKIVQAWGLNFASSMVIEALAVENVLIQTLNNERITNNHKHMW